MALAEQQPKPKKLSKNKMSALAEKRQKRYERIRNVTLATAGIATLAGAIYISRDSEEASHGASILDLTPSTPTALVEKDLNSLKQNHIDSLNLFPSAAEKQRWTIDWDKAENEIYGSNIPLEAKVLTLIDVTIGQMIISENDKYKAAGQFLDSHKDQIVYWASLSKDQLPPPDGQVFNIIPFVGETAPGETRMFYAIEYASDKAADEKDGELVGLKGANALVNASAMLSQIELFLNKPEFAFYTPLEKATALDNWLNNPETGKEETARLHAAALAEEIEASLIQSALLAPNVPVQPHSLTEDYLKSLDASKTSNTNFAENWLKIVKEKYLIAPPNGETI